MHLHQHITSALAPRLAAAMPSSRPSSSSSSAHVSEVSTIPVNITSYTQGLNGVNQRGNYLFINAVVVFFFALCAISLVLRLYNMGNNHLRHLFASGSGNEHQAYWMNNRSSWWPWLKKNVLYAPIWKKRHNREIQLSSAASFGTLPSRYHFLLLFVYVCSNLAYCAVLDYHQPKAAILAELRGRTGSLATINLVPTILFALRNNPLIPLLKVSYDTFNLLHRWVARLVVIEAIAHTIAFGINDYDSSKGWTAINKGLASSIFIQGGAVAVCVVIFMSIQAWSPIRHAAYETFLNVHRILAVATFVSIYVHVDKGKLPQLPYIQLVFVLWILEWLFRAGRISYYNVSRQRCTKVVVEALPSEACRVTLQLARPWKFQPGSNIHAYIPVVGLWSSHPFTVAWSQDHVVSMIDEKLPTNEYDLDRVENTRTSLSLIVRCRAGMTRKMYERASKAPMGMFTTFGAIEGPYGGHESLDSYGTVLLFAGGVGITHQMSYIRHLVSSCAERTVATRKIILVWSVPSTEALEWVRPWMDEILKMKGRREVLRIMLFVTKPKSQQEVISGTGTVQMFPGRCNPQTILDKEVVERIGAMAVTVCGPGSFADTVRLAVRKRVKVGQIDFIEEAFTY